MITLGELIDQLKNHPDLCGLERVYFNARYKSDLGTMHVSDGKHGDPKGLAFRESHSGQNELDVRTLISWYNEMLDEPANSMFDADTPVWLEDTQYGFFQPQVRVVDGVVSFS